MHTHYSTLRLAEDRPGVLSITLARPEARNAFNADVIRELHDVFTTRARSESVRAVLLTGEGKSFCAGADLHWMQASAKLGFDENVADARRMAEMFESIAYCPAPVVVKAFGHALGGGSGLVAAADVAFATTDTKFGFTEVKLGIIPAVISPYALRKVGQTHARRYFFSGELFDGTEAERIGLIEKAVAEADLSAAVDRYIDQLLAAGPHAVREAKRLISAVSGVEPKDAAEVTAPLIARVRTSPEAKEGMTAFFEKRPAAWTKDGR